VRIARFVGGGQEERPQHRTVHAIAERQLSIRASRRRDDVQNTGVSSWSGPQQPVHSAIASITVRLGRR
jgi:hypothetical protein